MSNNRSNGSVAKSDDPILKTVNAGHSAVLITGNINDFVLSGDEIAYRPQMIAEILHEHGFIVIRYSKSQGGRIHNYSTFTPKEKQPLDSRLNAVGLMPFLNKDGQHTPEEVRNFFRAVSRALQIPPGDSKPIAFVVDYAEHLAPAVATSAAAADEQTFVAETLHILANAPSLRKSGNLLICLARDGFQNALLNDLHRMDYPFPDENQARAFIQTIIARKSGSQTGVTSSLDQGFTEEEFARLTRGLRLRDIEAMLREARSEGVVLTRGRVLSSKAQAILRASEGTLAVMTTNLSINDIVGLEVNKLVFTRIAEGLRAGATFSPKAICIVGPPGTSKSTFAPILAAMCGFNVLEFQNVKNMYVGESERRLNLALSLIMNLAPAILFIDELTESIPARNSAVGDSGVSLDLLAQLFKFSARDDLRGRVLLLGATNVPERLDPAWHDRFLFIPFLELLPDEMCHLFGVFERRVTGRTSLNPSDPQLVEASCILHRKGTSPRKVMDIVNHALMFASTHASLAPEHILAAARAFTGSSNPNAIAYTSLVAISLTSFQTYLPWSLNSEQYVYPWYLEGVVDKRTGELDRQELYKRIDTHRKHTNL
jgi:hypothetical protein